ncbi:MAG: hypothetical protein WCC60_22550 [Ilumatobacteraceae bacterium]
MRRLYAGLPEGTEVRDALGTTGKIASYDETTDSYVVDFIGESRTVARIELSLVEDELPELPHDADISAWVDVHVGTLFPPTERVGDLSDLRILTARKQLLKHELAKNRQASLRSITRLGVTADGQWSGRGHCDVVAQVLASGAKMLNYVDLASPGNKWGHWARCDGATIKDPTWKQFFDPSTTKGRPPIFEGTADDFRVFGLDLLKTESYLHMFKLGDDVTTPKSGTAEFLEKEKRNDIEQKIAEWWGEDWKAASQPKGGVKK